MLQKNNKILYNKSIYSVADLFCSFPMQTFHLRQIARKTELSTTSVTSAVKTLKKEKIITENKRGFISEYKADLDSKAFFSFKKMFNLIKLQDSGLIEVLKKHFFPEAIVLFGYFSKGEDVEESVIEIFLVTPRRMTKRLEKILEIFEKKLKRKINIHTSRVTEENPDEFRNSLANGIVLHGCLVVV